MKWSAWDQWKFNLKQAKEIGQLFNVHRFGLVDDKIVDETLVDSEYIDDFGRKMPAKELMEVEEMHKRDVPDDISLVEMGCNVRKNESLDHREMDDRDFRERCIVANGRLYALYEKRKPDLAPRSDLRQEVLAKMLPNANYPDVDRFAKLARKMRFSRRVVLALIHGYTRPIDGVIEKSDGLKSLDAEGFAEVIGDLEAQVQELETLPEPETNSERTLDDERAYWLSVSQKLWENGQFGDGLAGVLAQIRFIESSAARDVVEYYVDPDHVDNYTIYLNEESVDGAVYQDPDEMEWDPEMTETAMAIDSNTYGAHPLYDESSGLSHVWINEIKTATWKRLSDAKKWLMGSDSWYLTSEQRSMAWGFVKDREDQLIAQAMRRPIARMVASYITKANSKRACAALFAWKQCDRFDTEMANFKFDQQPPLEEELAAAWTIFRREHKEHQRSRRIEQARGKYSMFAYRDRNVELKTDADGKTYAVVEKTKMKRIAVRRS